MKIFITLAALFVSLNSHNLSAQQWSTVGSGLGQDTSYNMDVETDGNAIYVSEILYDRQISKLVIRLKKWDGQSWVQLPDYISNPQPFWAEFGDMEIFQGEVYIGLVKRTGHRLIRFDGSNWHEVPFSDNTGIHGFRSLEVHNNELIIGGHFNFSEGGSTYSNSLSYDGTGIQPYSGLVAEAQTVYDLHSHNGTLYGKADKLYRLNGTSWGNPVQFTQGTTTANPALGNMVSHNSQLYGSYGGFYEFNNDTAHYLGHIDFKVTDIEEYNGDLYIVGDSAFAWPSPGGGLMKYDGQTLQRLTAPPGLREAAVFQGELYFFSSSTIEYNGTFYNKAFRMENTFSASEYSGEDLDLDIYPNPAMEEIKINNRSNLPVRLGIFDETGRLTGEIDAMPGKETSYPTGDLAEGVYMIRSENSVFRILIR